MAFVPGYLTVMDSQPQYTNALMDSHLQDLMEDGEAYGWPVVRDFHSTWLQYIEMERTTWDDHPTKLKLRCTIVWHRVASATQGSSPNRQPETEQPYHPAHRSSANPHPETQQPTTHPTTSKEHSAQWQTR